MSFWQLSDDTLASETGKEFDGGGGKIEPIPEKTSVLFMPDEAKWAQDRGGNEFISIRWTVLKPEAYANRKIFTKLWVSDEDPRAKNPSDKRDKALRMLSAIDSNSGGKLLRKGGRPTDDDLALALTGKQMVGRLGLWSMKADDGSDMSGNYVQAISGKDKPITEVAPKKNGNGAGGIRAKLPFEEELEDDVPFASNGVDRVGRVF